MNNIIYDWSDVAWNVLGIIAMFAIIILLIRFVNTDVEHDHNETLIEKRSHFDHIQEESIYCGHPAEKVVINDLYKAAKRARKDKSLSRDVRMDLDKAINQYEKHVC